MKPRVILGEAKDLSLDAASHKTVSMIIASLGITVRARLRCD
jgi:hypothetical protein